MSFVNEFNVTCDIFFMANLWPWHATQWLANLMSAAISAALNCYDPQKPYIGHRKYVSIVTVPPWWSRSRVSSGDCTVLYWVPWCWLLRTWWHHEMETLPCYWPFVRGLHQSPVDSPYTVMQGFDVLFDIDLYKLLNKQLNHQLFEATWHSFVIIVIKLSYYLHEIEFGRGTVWAMTKTVIEKWFQYL